LQWRWKQLRWVLVRAAVVCGLGCAGSTSAHASTIQNREFRTSDGIRLHYLEAGQGEPTLVFVPGWLMPARIFEAQLVALSARHRVVVLDPRSQGESELYAGPHTAVRRAADISEFVAEVKPVSFVLVGWSLGVMEGLDYVERFRPTALRGLVLVDNSIGEASPPKPATSASTVQKVPQSRTERLRAFVRGLFAHTPPDALLRLVEASVLRVPAAVAAELLAKPYSREYYKNAIYRAQVPVLYAIRPRLADQGAALKAHLPESQVTLYPNAGHALFVDEALDFNADLERFLDKLPTS